MTTSAPRLRRLFSLAAVALLSVASATAQQSEDVKVALTASKIIPGKAGQEELAPADKAKPGDVLKYEAVYRNTGKAPVANLDATIPIPAGLEFIAASATPAGAQGSTNGQEFTPLPLVRKAAGKDEPVPLAEHRAVRWRIPALAPGASATVSLRARVLTNSPAQPATKP